MRKHTPYVRLIEEYRRNYLPYMHLKDLSEIRRRLFDLAASLAMVNKTDEDIPFDLVPPEARNYVYMFADPRKPKGDYRYVCPSGKRIRSDYPIFYVGKGKDNRALEHYKEARSDPSKWRNRFKCRVFRKIWEAGLEPVLMITPSRASNNLARALEIDLIAGIGRKAEGGPLTNVAIGGEGPTGQRLSLAQRARLSAVRKGVPKTAEHNRKNSEANKGRPKTGRGAKGHHKTSAHNRKNSEAQQRNAARIAALPDIECDVCSKRGRLLLGHFTNCRGPKFRDVPDKRSRSSLPSVFCPHCNTECRGPKFIEHFGNCPHKP